MESSFEFSGIKNDFYIDLSAEVYEKMNVHNSDKYEFVYPNYSLSKLFNLENRYLVLPLHHKVSVQDAKYISELVNKYAK